MRDGELFSLIDDATYLLSPQDFCAVERVPELIDAGVTTLKIEGRLKSPEYVYVSTLAYRNAIDEAWAARAPAPAGNACAASPSPSPSSASSAPT